MALSGTFTDGSQNTSLLYNPYKFSAYRNAAWTAGNNVFAKVAFDTELFDTSNNFDAVTNNRFIAPVAGFYFFSGGATSSVTAGNYVGASLYKNGSEIARGNEIVVGAATVVNTAQASGLLQLAINDYVELYHIGTAGAGSTGSNLTYFHGFLVSLT